MKRGVLLRINCQSFSDVITNSSSEIFCQVQCKDVNSINTIAEYLNSILPMNVEPNIHEAWDNDDEDRSTIDFWCEMGSFYDYEYIPDVFATLLRETLNQHFREGIDYTIETNVDC